MPKKAAPKASAASSSTPEKLTEIALVALKEVAEPGSFDTTASFTHSDGVITAHFPSLMAGYPGWSWTVALADNDGQEPTVLELELLPGETALLSPAWVPWADRLEEYLLHEKELKEAADLDGDDSDDDLDDDVDMDDDVDGVDIDQLDIGLDPAPLEIPDEPDDLFDHIEDEKPQSAAAAKKPVAKKPVVKKPAAKKTVATTPAAPKAEAKKSAAKKPATKKSS
jgi:hypothetical protein